MNHSKDEIIDIEPYFSRWMDRLTSEGLHEKSDIAFELARLHKALDELVTAGTEHGKYYIPCLDSASELLDGFNV